ncbi:MAG TPA: cupin domain-containing protein [Stellaceae bacterium]|nr:cupin domain-containing protein [Stellaceae bacterium]
MNRIQDIHTGNASLPPANGKKASVVKGSAQYRAEQGSQYSPGISAETVGARSLWLGIVTLPPGQRTKAHVHDRHETAFYMLSGIEVEVWTGDQLQYKDVTHAGDYLFIPANVLHVAVNRGSEPAVFIGSRNEATAQESVVMRPEMDARVP